MTLTLTFDLKLYNISTNSNYLQLFSLFIRQTDRQMAGNTFYSKVLGSHGNKIDDLV